MSQTTVTFFGGAGTVTGSKHLVTAEGRRVLLDCGLFQGLKELRLRNWSQPPFDPLHIDAVVLSHAHLDHCGYLPVLVRGGFRGSIVCTSGTADLLRLILMDSAHLQEEEAEHANEGGYSRHQPALPLYTVGDVQQTLTRVVVRPYDQEVPLVDGLRLMLRRAGHILGASTVELRIGSGPLRLVFSGDLGRPHQPILRDPEPIAQADVLLLESTYGDRVHAHDPEGALARIVNDAIARGGAIIVPSFAVGRTQHLVWLLRKLEDERRIPEMPVFIDSPMALEAGAMYERHAEDQDEEMTRRIAEEGTLHSHRLHLVKTPAESKALNKYDQPFIVIAGNGMATGGRVLYHLRLRLPNPKTTVLLVGFQAAGTRGRALQDGAPMVKIQGEEVPVRATVRSLEGLSAHADREELLAWLSGFTQPPKQTYLVHGEPEQARALAATIRQRLGWDARPAQDGETVGL